MVESINSIILEMPDGKYANSLKKLTYALDAISKTEQDMQITIHSKVVDPLSLWSVKAQRLIERERKIVEERRQEMESEQRKDKKQIHSDFLECQKAYEAQAQHLTDVLNKLPDEQKKHEEILKTYMERMAKYHSSSLSLVTRALVNF